MERTILQAAIMLHDGWTSIAKLEKLVYSPAFPPHTHIYKSLLQLVFVQLLTSELHFLLHVSTFDTKNTE